MPALLGLVRAGRRRLDDDRVAELARRLRRASSRAAGDPLGDERDAVRSEQRPHLRRLQPGVGRAGEQPRDERPARRGRSMPSSSGDAPGRPAEPLGALGRPAERAGRRLRIREGCDARASAAQQRRRRALGADERRRAPACRLGAAASTARTTASATSSALGDDGRDEEHDHRVDAGSASRCGSTASYVCRSPSRACRPGSRDSPRAAAARRALRASRSESGGSSSPAASQASAQRIPSPPAFVSSATRRPRGSGCVESRAATSIELLERVGPDHAGLAEERLDRGLRAGERGGVRAGGRAARASSGRPSWRGSASCARRAARGARTSAGCRTTRGRAGSDRSRGRPPSTRAGRSTRRPPCSRSRRRPRDRGRGRFAASSRARPSAPLCDEKPMLPAGRMRGAKVAFSRHEETAMPRQFGPISRAPCARTSASSCSWRRMPSGPVSAKPAEITQSARVPLRSASSAAASTRSPGTQMTARSTLSGMSAIEG